MDKIYAFIQKTPLAQKVAILAIFLGLIVGGYWYFGYRSKVEERKKLEKQYELKEDELEEKKQIAANFTEYKKEVECMQQVLAQKEKSLPSDSNMDLLLKTLNELSEQSEIRISSFTPKPELKKDFYAEIPVLLELEGNYHEIVKFFDDVSKEERIVNISDINMKLPEMINNKVLVKALCQAKTFRAIPLSEQQAAQTPQKGKPGKPGKPANKP